MSVGRTSLTVTSSSSPLCLVLSVLRLVHGHLSEGCDKASSCDIEKQACCITRHPRRRATSEPYFATMTATPLQSRRLPH
jgi:hypothetical protein